MKFYEEKNRKTMWEKSLVNFFASSCREAYFHFSSLKVLKQSQAKRTLIRDFYEFLARRQSEKSNSTMKKMMMRNKNKKRLLKSLIRVDLMAFVCGAVQSSFYIIKLLLLFTKTNTLNGETCGQPSTVYFRY